MVEEYKRFSEIYLFSFILKHVHIISIILKGLNMNKKSSTASVCTNPEGVEFAIQY